MGLGTCYGVPVGTMASIAYGVPVCQPLFQTFFKNFLKVPGSVVIARDSGIIDIQIYINQDDGSEAAGWMVDGGKGIQGMRE